jgi:Ca-activated chloride channel homolog
MTFHWPHAFWLLLVPLALFARDLLRHRSAGDKGHPKIRQAEARHSSLIIHEASHTPRPYRRSPLAHRAYIYLALIFAVCALARPQWGRLDEPVFDQAREIIIALDLSRSMLATDVKPNRLERARLLITSLLERLKGERVGLIVFSGTAFLQSPLSSDYEILREFLPVLDPSYLPEGGTNFDALLDTTVSAFGASGSADRFLIVLSDGEAQSDTWQKHLATLKTKGIRVLGLGIGTAEGSMISDGEGAFVKDESGAVVLSRLDPSTLRELAEKTNGAYVDASNWVDLSELIQRTVEQGRRGDFKETSHIRLAERFQWPLAAALVFFLLAYWRDFPVQPRARNILLARSTKTAASLAFLAALLLANPTAASAGAELAAPASQPNPAATLRPPSSDGGEAALSAPVTQLVTRLARLEQPAAADYAALASATLAYGESLHADHKPVPPGPVQDALAAVDAGEQHAPKAADWSGLRSQLRELLKKDESSQPPPEQPKSDEKKPDQDKNQKKDDAPKDPQNSKGDSSADKNQSQQSGSGQNGQPPPSSDKDSQPKDPSGSDANKGSGSADQKPSDTPPKSPGSPGQSAFGDMKDTPPPPAHDAKKPQPAPTQGQKPDEMQQVGGADPKASTDPARLDPSLSIPLQKLDQVKQGDSPARLFQLLQEPGSDQQPPAAKGKNW